jgi:colicin import membrane protein
MSETLDPEVTPEPGTSLAVIKAQLPTIISLDKNDLLGSLAKKIAAFVPDLSTKKSRDEWASLGYEIATTKTALIKIGKASIEEAKRHVAATNAECNALEDRMDTLKANFLEGLTAWRQIEKDRVAGHEAALKALSDLFDLLPADAPPAQIKESLDRLDDYEDGREWQEFAQRASDTHAATGFRLTQALNAALAREEAAREAERRRQEGAETARLAAERAQREREARIAAEAAERGRLEAEARAAEAAAAERQRVEQERLDAEDARREAELAAQAEIDALEEAARIAAAQAEEQRLAAERQAREAEDRAARAEQQRVAAQRLAEKQRIEAAAKAKRDQEAAVEAERARVAAERAAEELAAAERARNLEIRRKVNFAAAAALVVHAGITEQQAQLVIVAIAKNSVPSVRISY